MAPVRIAINGFGRIGRVFTRIAAVDPEIEIVAINDLLFYNKKKDAFNAKWAAHLFKYDTVYGPYDLDVSLAGEDRLKIGDRPEIRLTAVPNPAELPWGELDVDVVIEATGVFRDPEKAKGHLEAGAKKVLITAPPRGEKGKETLQILWRINEDEYEKRGKPDIVSAASCTTNSLGPVVKVLHEAFGIENGFLTTVHAYTNDQRIVDAFHDDLARARAAAANIIPTSTGAARAIPRIFPDLEGKMDGIAMRVPVPCGSVSDFTATLKREVTVEEVNEAFKKAAETPLGEVMKVVEEPIVSSDVLGESHSAVVALAYTMVLPGSKRTVKVLSFYDNEWGYCCRLLDVAKFIAG
ncbi:type I glyceraldehyde-3-phosphate dehydrogenase [Candidatus Bipolaricaulota sp. J31]